MYKELDWSHADLIFTHFHNLIWEIWKLIFHSVGMFKPTSYVAVQNHLPTNMISSKAGFAYRTSNSSQIFIPNTLSKYGMFFIEWTADQIHSGPKETAMQFCPGANKTFV